MNRCEYILNNNADGEESAGLAHIQIIGIGGRSVNVGGGWCSAAGVAAEARLGHLACACGCGAYLCPPFGRSGYIPLGLGPGIPFHIYIRVIYDS